MGIPIKYRTKDFQNSTYKKCSPLPLFINKNWALTPPGINVQRIIYEYFNGILTNQLFTPFFMTLFSFLTKCFEFTPDP